MQQKFAAVPVGGWPEWGAAEMSCLSKKLLSVPCVFFSFSFFSFLVNMLHYIFLFGMQRISGRSHSLRSGLSQRQLSSAIVVLARALYLHFSSLHHGDIRSREDKPKSRKKKPLANLACNPLLSFMFHVHTHRGRLTGPGAILFLCLPARTRPGLDLGLSRTATSAFKSAIDICD